MLDKCLAIIFLYINVPQDIKVDDEDDGPSAERYITFTMVSFLQVTSLVAIDPQEWW